MMEREAQEFISMKQKLNFLFLFLLLLTSTVSANSGVSVNNHVIYINNVSRFPTHIVNLCNFDYDDKLVYGYQVETCAASVNKFPNITYMLDIQGNDISYYNTSKIALYEAAGLYWTVNWPSSYQSTFYPANRNQAHFIGTRNCCNENEPGSGGEPWANLGTYRGYILGWDAPQLHPVFYNHYNYMIDIANAPAGDIIEAEAYFHKSHTDFALADWLYIVQGEMWHNFANNHEFDFIAASKTVVMEFWHIGNSTWQENPSLIWYSYSNNESRGEAFLAIVMGAHGIGWDGYKDATTSSPFGIIRNATAITGLNNLAGEIKQLEPILLMNSTAYSWGANYHIDNTVIFTNNTAKAIPYESGDVMKMLNYRIFGNSTNSYLIVVNVDKNATWSTMHVSFLNYSGNQNVTTIGTYNVGSGKAGRTMVSVNGTFSDYFDGYAAHVYQINGSVPVSNGTETNPNPTWSNWNNWTGAEVTEDRGSHHIKIGYFADDFEDNNLDSWVPAAGKINLVINSSRAIGLYSLGANTTNQASVFGYGANVSETANHTVSYDVYDNGLQNTWEVYFGRVNDIYFGVH